MHGLYNYYIELASRVALLTTIHDRVSYRSASASQPEHYNIYITESCLIIEYKNWVFACSYAYVVSVAFNVRQ